MKYQKADAILKEIQKAFAFFVLAAMPHLVSISLINQDFIRIPEIVFQSYKKILSAAGRMEYNNCKIFGFFRQQKGTDDMFISPKYDDCMKALFHNELVCKYFISDVLGIPIGEIRSIRLADTFLRRRYRFQKLGILDAVLEMNDDTKFNIELQVKRILYWDRRQLFYLCRLYTEETQKGEKYDGLRRCISISILDFNLTEDEEYHNVYRLRNQQGHVFSDRLEIHTIELKKELEGEEPVNDWIRLFNAKSEDELDMIRTKNVGIREAVRVIREYNLPRRLRLQYQYHQKYLRDQNARESYVKEEGREEGLKEGLEKGLGEGVRALVETCRELGLSQEETLVRLRQKISVSEEEAEQYVEQYWR